MNLVTNDIRADFFAFADPATLMNVTDRDLTWVQGGEERTVRLTPSADPGFPQIRFQGELYGYRQFFASSHMADLRAIAETQVRIAKVRSYVDSLVLVDEITTDALPALRRLTEPQNRTRTSIIFLQGEAGSGKTTLLRTFTTQIAKSFLEGEADHLALYVDAQNRSLARLDEAIALTLQDIRTRFTYHAVATLSRINLLIPIIDGFDELLGARGYDDALASLIRFLSRLSGEGVVLTSARSTFYRFQNVGWLKAPAAAEQLNFEIRSATLLPWNDKQIEEAITLVSVAEALNMNSAHDVLVRTKGAVHPDVWQLFSIPFFVFAFFSAIKTLANTPPKNAALPDWQRVLPQILEGFAREGLGVLAVIMIEREVPKLRGPDDQPLLLPDVHEKFLEEIAEEMWLQETRVLDRPSVEAILELVVEAEGQSALLELLKGRAVVHPLLISSEDGTLTFRHELFFSYFIALSFWRALSQGDERLYRIFGRGTITSTTAEELAKKILLSTKDIPFATSLERLAPKNFPPSARGAARRNAGSVVAGAIRLTPGKFAAVTISDLVFDHENLTKTTLHKMSFERCEFTEVDLRGASWNEINLSTCLLSRLVLGSDTILKEVALPSQESIVGIIFDGTRMFDPATTLNILTKLGAVTPDSITEPTWSEDASRRIQLFRRFARCAQRSFRFSNDDLENARLLKDQDWPRLEAALARHDLLETESVQRRGSIGQLRRLAVSADEIELALTQRKQTSNSNVVGFWQDYLEEIT